MYRCANSLRTPRRGPLHSAASPRARCPCQGGASAPLRAGGLRPPRSFGCRRIRSRAGARRPPGAWRRPGAVCRTRLHAAGIAPEIDGRMAHFLIYRSLSDEARAEIMAIVEIATEYGQQVGFIEPTVIDELLNRSRSRAFGARPERFLIDEILGGEFAKAARRLSRGPIAVLGPPFRCEASGEAQASHLKQP